MCVGKPPFVSKNHARLLVRIMTHRKLDHWGRHISEECKDVINSLLIPDASKRSPLHQVHESEWVKFDGDVPPKHPTSGGPRLGLLKNHLPPTPLTVTRQVEAPLLPKGGGLQGFGNLQSAPKPMLFSSRNKASSSSNTNLCLQSPMLPVRMPSGGNVELYAALPVGINLASTTNLNLPKKMMTPLVGSRGLLENGANPVVVPGVKKSMLDKIIDEEEGGYHEHTWSCSTSWDREAPMMPIAQSTTGVVPERVFPAPQNSGLLKMGSTKNLFVTPLMYKSGPLLQHNTPLVQNRAINPVEQPMRFAPGPR